MSPVFAQLGSSAFDLLCLALLIQTSLSAGYLGSRVLERLHLPAATVLHLDRALLLLSLACPLLLPHLLPDPGDFRPPAQVFDGSEGGDVAVQWELWARPIAMELPGEALSVSALILSALAARGLFRLFRGYRDLSRLRAGTTPWRRVGGVSVRQAPVPGLALTWGSLRGPQLLLDAGLLADPQSRVLSLRHELGHIRQGDHWLAWCWALLDACFGWNPLIGAWSQAAEIRAECAVDARVVAQRGVSPRAYGQLLVTTARRAAAAHGVQRALSQSHTLQRRLLMLARPPRPSPLHTGLFVALASLTLGLTSLLGSAFAEDVRIDPDRLSAARAQTPTVSELCPQADDPVVQAELRILLGKAGRFTEGALSRRPAWAPLVDGALHAANLPHELAAVPLVESGYTNWGHPTAVRVGSQAPGTVPGAGLWMFIPTTARAYGLQVDQTTDERLDPVAETEAAIHLLSDLHDKYGDWRLALAGYNMGEKAVDRAIREGHSTDPWTLIRNGHLNAYPAQVCAAALILAAEVD